MHFYALAILMVLPSCLQASTDDDRVNILERIKPIGQVRVEKSATTSAKETKKAEGGSETPRTGQSIYEQHCITCHEGGLAGAPKFHNASDWEPRLKGKTINDLVGIAIHGLNAMPPKGTCSECSDADIKTAIEYMVPKK